MMCVLREAVTKIVDAIYKNTIETTTICLLNKEKKTKSLLGGRNEA